MKGDSQSFFKGLGVSCLNYTCEQFVPVFHFLVRKLYYLYVFVWLPKISQFLNFFAHKFKYLISFVTFFVCFFAFFFLQLRKAQDEIGELQTVNDHLQKRFDKLKSKRKDDT